MRSFRGGLLFVVLAISAMAGCGPAGTIRLVQPQLTGRQREVKLETVNIYWTPGESPSDEGTERFLAEFPLPGARRGRPTYLLYLRVPAGQPTVTFGEAGGKSGRGFLIQARGEYAGKALVTEGQATVSGTSQARDASRRLEIELKCEDGSRIQGELRARRDDWHVSQFETRRRPADVKALEAGSAAPAAISEEPDGLQ